MAKMWETAHFVYRDRMESLDHPEHKKFRRLSNSVCYRLFDIKSKRTYPNGEVVEEKVRLTYSDLDFTWAWARENALVSKKSWRGFMVAGLYVTIDGARRFLAKVTPAGAWNVDLGIRSYIDEAGILIIHMDANPTVDEQTDDQLPGLPMDQTPAIEPEDESQDHGIDMDDDISQDEKPEDEDEEYVRPDDDLPF